MVGDCILSEKKESAFQYTIKYIFFAAVLLAAAALLYYAYDRFVPHERTMFPVSSEPFGTVIIDAGHGGMDGGATSDSGTLEKELNFEISLLLRDVLQASGVQVILTRDCDEMLDCNAKGGSRKTRDLRARVEIAEANPDALFVSIHMNKFPSASVSGVQLYYSPNNPESEVLAQMIQSSVKSLLQPDNNRPLKAADSKIYVLHRTKNPAVLVECGFLSNYEEEQLLLDNVYRHKLTLTIAASIIEYLQGQYN